MVHKVASQHTTLTFMLTVLMMRRSIRGGVRDNPVVMSLTRLKMRSAATRWLHHKDLARQTGSNAVQIAFFASTIAK
jgi:hypothetical protein